MTTKAEFQKELAELIAALQPTIREDYRAYDDCEEDSEPSMLLTIGADSRGWGWQTGDNSFFGGAYGYAYWGVVGLTRYASAAELAGELLSDLESGADEDTKFFFDGEG